MEWLFKRYFWVLNSLLLIIAGFLSARTVVAFVQYELLKPPAEGVRQEELAADEGDESFRREQTMRSVDLERRRKLTESAILEPQEEVPPPDNSFAPPTEQELEPVATETEEPIGEISLELLASITVSDPAKNMALVRIDGGENNWVGVGTMLKPGFEVTAINNYYITASHDVTELLWKKREAPTDGRKGALAGGPPRTGPPPRATPEPSPMPEPEPPVVSDKYAEGVKQVGPFEYRIDRGMLNEQLQDLAKLGREARVIPNYDKDSGTYKGFKLIGVRPNSLYRAIGIRSGDVIKQINGEELNSPGKALELFTQLQNSNNISLDIDRRGKNQTMTYTIE